MVINDSDDKNGLPLKPPSTAIEQRMPPLKSNGL